MTRLSDEKKWKEMRGAARNELCSVVIRSLDHGLRLRVTLSIYLCHNFTNMTNWLQYTLDTLLPHLALRIHVTSGWAVEQALAGYPHCICLDLVRVERHCCCAVDLHVVYCRL